MQIKKRNGSLADFDIKKLKLQFLKPMIPWLNLEMKRKLHK